MSFIHSNIEVRDTRDSTRGLGLFATGLIRKGELVTDTTGETQILTKREISKLSEEQQGWCYEIDDKHEMCPRDFSHLSPIWRMNHSCDPNVGSALDLHHTFAMRDIEEGEEITYDYAMTDAGKWDFVCACGKPNCRKFVTGNDWKIPELQQRYRGYFQENIQEKIDHMRRGR